MRINTNVTSSLTQSNLRKVEDQLAKTMEKLSSGKRINSAADDAAGLAITVRMESASRGKEVALRNTLDGVSALQTADSAMGTVTNILQRMRELAVQASNGVNSDSELSAMNTEYTALSQEIEKIAETAKFNGVELLNGSYDVTLQVGHLTTDTRQLAIGTDYSALTAIGGDLTTGASAAIDLIDADLETVATDRANIGALQNRLSFVQDDLDSSKVNVDAAKSRIEDADMAAEVSKMARQQIINNSAISMLGKANAAPQGFMQLLQG